MIKRILVALDSDADTPVVTEYAIQLARRVEASLTGLAIVDMEDIYATVGAGGIGTIYYAEQLRESLTEENRTQAQKLLEAFHDAVDQAGIVHVEELEEGVPYERIIEEMKFHDLLVVGRDSHFFYSHPKKETHTLEKVIKKGITPTLVVSEPYRIVKRVLVAFDKSAASARALQSFIHLLPYGTEITIELVHIVDEDSDDARQKADLLLQLAQKYLKAHSFDKVQLTALKKGQPGKQLLELIDKTTPELVILGAHSMSAIKRVTFGSTTYDLVRKSRVALFLNN